MHSVFTLVPCQWNRASATYQETVYGHRDALAGESVSDQKEIDSNPPPRACLRQR